MKRAFEDVEKKLNILFDQMNNSEVSDDIISKLKELVKGKAKN